MFAIRDIGPANESSKYTNTGQWTAWCLPSETLDLRMNHLRTQTQVSEQLDVCNQRHWTCEWIIYIHKHRSMNSLMFAIRDTGPANESSTYTNTRQWTAWCLPSETLDLRMNHLHTQTQVSGQLDVCHQRHWTCEWIIYIHRHRSVNSLMFAIRDIGPANESSKYTNTGQWTVWCLPSETLDLRMNHLNTQTQVSEQLDVCNKRHWTCEWIIYIHKHTSVNSLMFAIRDIGPANESSPYTNTGQWTAWCLPSETLDLRMNHLRAQT